MLGDEPTGQPTASSAANVTYTVNTDTSDLSFQAKAFGLAWVRGQLPITAGTIHITGDTLYGHGELAADQVETGLAVRDWHLRSKHYLHAAAHPRIRVTLDAADLAADSVTCRVIVRETSSTVTAHIHEKHISGQQLQLHTHIDLDRTCFPMLPPLAGVSRMVQLRLSLVAQRS